MGPKLTLRGRLNGVLGLFRLLLLGVLGLLVGDLAGGLVLDLNILLGDSGMLRLRLDVRRLLGREMSPAAVERSLTECPDEDGSDQRSAALRLNGGRSGEDARRLFRDGSLDDNDFGRLGIWVERD